MLSLGEVTSFNSGESCDCDAEALEAGLRMGQQKIDSDYAPGS
jgi:hypothetical protein